VENGDIAGVMRHMQRVVTDSVDAAVILLVD
jgi:hypothetical protein